MDHLVIGAAAVSFVAAGLSGDLRACLVPAVLVPLAYLGAREGWWGSGVGDGWHFVGAVVTVALVGATAIVAALRRRASP